MNTKTEWLVRITGGLEADLDGVGLTTRGVAFECPAELAQKLLKDGSGRFRKASDQEAGRIRSERKAASDAKLKAAGPPPSTVKLQPPPREGEDQ